MQRTMAFDYALDFLGGAVEPAEALVRGMDWRAGTTSRCVGGGSEKGQPAAPKSALPISASFLAIEAPRVVLSSFRRDSRGMFVLRLYNPSGEEAAGRVRLFFDIGKCLRLGLDEEVGEELPAKDREVDITVEAGRILTLGFQAADRDNATRAAQGEAEGEAQP